MLVAKLQGNSFGAHYKLLVDETFETRSVGIEKTGAGKEIMTRIEFRDDKWIVDGKDRADLRECTDIDIEASPVTNTIPIRRYGLKVGSAGSDRGVSEISISLGGSTEAIL